MATRCRLHAMLPSAGLLTRRRGDHPVHTATTARRWTADEVRALPDDGNRYEVVEGELLLTPAPC